MTCPVQCSVQIRLTLRGRPILLIVRMITNQTGHLWSTRFPAVTAVGATFEKPVDLYRREKKNTSETLNIVTKDRTSQTMQR